MSFDLGSELLKGAVVTVETSLGKFDVDLDPSTPSGPWMDWIKPKVTVKRDGTVLAEAAPYGEPDSNYALGFVLLGLAGVVLWIALR